MRAPTSPAYHEIAPPASTSVRYPSRRSASSPRASYCATPGALPEARPRLVGDDRAGDLVLHLLARDRAAVERGGAPDQRPEPEEARADLLEPAEDDHRGPLPAPQRDHWNRARPVD